MTTRNDMHDRNRRNIEEFRASGGRVGGNFEGAPLLLLTTTGAKSGQQRVNPLMYLPDGERWIVFASKGGAPSHPDWFRNLSANPTVTVEVGCGALRGHGRDTRRRGARPSLRTPIGAVSAVRRLPGEDDPCDSGGRAGPVRVRLGGTAETESCPAG